MKRANEHYSNPDQTMFEELFEIWTDYVIKNKIDQQIVMRVSAQIFLNSAAWCGISIERFSAALQTMEKEFPKMREKLFPQSK